MKKTCSRCDKSLDLSKFRNQKRSKDGKQSWCGPCTNAYHRDRWDKDTSHRESRKQRAAERRRRLALLVQNIKESTQCADCRRYYPHYVMDFDHVRGSKVAEVSALVKAGVSEVSLRGEMAKCEVVCANCHRIRTHSGLRGVGKR